MKFAAFLLAMMPALAWAQQTPVPQSALPTLQQALDQESAQVADIIASMRSKIAQDQQVIATMNQENSSLSTKNGDLQRQVSNLQAQLDAAKTPKQ